MDIFDAIKNRRSIGRVKADPIEREVIEKLLEAASWAPSHHQTEPWKFFVLTGAGRKPLGRRLAEIAKESMDDPHTEENQKLVNKQLEKPYRAPLIIAVAVTPSENPKVIRLEEIGAVNAAIQNMLLAAHALGLGAIWRTGKPTYHPKMKELFGLKEQDEMLGFIYLGYPSMEQSEGRRSPYEEKTVWIDSDRRNDNIELI